MDDQGEHTNARIAFTPIRGEHPREARPGGTVGRRVIFRIFCHAGAYDGDMDLRNAALWVALNMFAAACSPGAPAPTPSKPAGPTVSPLAPPAHAEFVGPAELDMQPGSRPLDLSARAFPADVERERLEKDVALIWRVRSLLPPASTSASELLRALGAEKVKDESDFGFGVRSQSASIEGGYVTCGVALGTHDDALEGLQLTCTARLHDTPEVVLATLKEALGPAFTVQSVPVYFMASVEYTRASEHAARALLDQTLGPLDPIAEDKLTAEVLAAYRRLMSPVESLVVGYECGIVGTTPPGAAAEFTLQSEKRVDLLRNVLRGPNPGGRMYAFRALTRLKALRAEDEAVVKALSSTETPVQTCHGCMFSTETTADVLEESFY
jgi:hypothetical protein